VSSAKLITYLLLISRHMVIS